jgi:hypothetical protein
MIPQVNPEEIPLALYAGIAFAMVAIAVVLVGIVMLLRRKEEPKSFIFPAPAHADAARQGKMPDDLVRIKDVMRTPDKYMGKKVSIAGEARLTSRSEIDLFFWYRLEDGTGTIAMETKSQLNIIHGIFTGTMMKTEEHGLLYLSMEEYKV